MRIHQKRQLKVMVLVLASALVLCSMPGELHAQTSNPLAFTFDGPVRGTVNSAGVHEFLGIPYAAPPVGNLRWRPPVTARSLVPGSERNAIREPLPATGVAVWN